MTKKNKTLLWGVISIILVAVIATYIYASKIISTGFDINKTVYITIDSSRNYDGLIAQIKETAHIQNIENFKTVASFLKYEKNIKSGRYEITPTMNVLDVVRLLKSGHQSPVKLKFNNIRTKEDLALRISSQLMLTEQELLLALNNPAIYNKYNLTSETIVCMFIPNTYEFYWDVKLEKFLDRMNAEYLKFWNNDRIELAKKIGLTPVEVSILASIVEEECYFSDEYPMVAGLYLNRLQKEHLLQADPTVKFAVGDFSLKRILNKHLAIDSPYNTYRRIGLPPGPIRIPSIKGIDSVLNAANHDYFYMCAKEDFSGRHNFSKDFAGHLRNAQRYQTELNKRRIF